MYDRINEKFIGNVQRKKRAAEEFNAAREAKAIRRAEKAAFDATPEGQKRIAVSKRTIQTIAILGAATSVTGAKQ